MAMLPAAAPYRASGLVLWHYSDPRRCRVVSASRGTPDVAVRRHHGSFWPPADIDRTHPQGCLGL